MKFWQKQQKSFSIPPFKFTIFELWREAFKCGIKAWLLLLLADAVLIIVANVPIWMPLLGQWFPFLKMFQINPPWMQDNIWLAKFAAISKLAMPYLFILFITAPLYLGVNLLALRIVYKRPAQLSLLRHYFQIYWWSSLTSIVLLSGILIVPALYLLKMLLQIASNPSYQLQFYIATSLFVIAMIVSCVLLSMLLQLVFGARVNIINAAVMSCKATSRNFFRIAGMLLLFYIVERLRYQTHYLSDILLMPPSMIAWALLYKRIYGEKGLIE
jgi:hypothetical protein